MTEAEAEEARRESKKARDEFQDLKKKRSVIFVVSFEIADDG